MPSILSALFERGRLRLVALAAGLAVAALPLLHAAFAAADERHGPVVVELYSSQGCSSCPPADALLRELDEREDVIALGLHVDYWDYMGWRDGFASPRFSDRQKRYARARDQRTVYTPQFVIDGVHLVAGARRDEIEAWIRAARARPEPVVLEAERVSERVRARVAPAGEPVGPCTLQIVRYRPRATVEIRGGENAGKRITYANIVTEWRPFGRWDGARPAVFETAAPGSAPVVVIVQSAEPGGLGEILAARRLR